MMFHDFAYNIYSKDWTFLGSYTTVYKNNRMLKVGDYVKVQNKFVKYLGPVRKQSELWFYYNAKGV